MKKMLKKLGIVAVLAIIGFSMTACPSPRGYAIGDTGPGGGIVFYHAPNGFTMTDTGQKAYYLEVWTTNEASSGWEDQGQSVTGITTFPSLPASEAGIIGNGRKDTQLIVAHMVGEGISVSAAQSCASATHGGKNDWFLPSLGELNELYKAKGQPNVPTSGLYWSSSQYNNNGAWAQNFANGGQSGSNKNLSNSVRAIRAF